MCFLGFREKDHITPLNASGGHKISNESLTRTESGIHNRTYSDGGSSIGSNTNNNYPPPPSGPRVVLGRETTPTMSGGGSSQNITITNDQSRLSKDDIARMTAEAETYAKEDEEFKDDGGDNKLVNSLSKDHFVINMVLILILKS